MIDLKTAKVIVTGGNEGVGLEMARALVQRGAEVTVIARGRNKFGDAHDAGARSIVGDATVAAVIDRAIADVDPREWGGTPSEL